MEVKAAILPLLQTVARTPNAAERVALGDVPYTCEAGASTYRCLKDGWLVPKPPTPLQEQLKKAQMLAREMGLFYALWKSGSYLWSRIVRRR